jgi:hypothetical protein
LSYAHSTNAFCPFLWYFFIKITLFFKNNEESHGGAPKTQHSGWHTDTERGGIADALFGAAPSPDSRLFAKITWR